MEIWKTIEGFENYEISNLGNIKSNQLNKKEKLLKLRKTKFGYARVILYNKEIRKDYLVHRLVALHFIKNYNNNKLQVNHIDCNKLNNSVENLEWCTQSENIIHSLNNGRNKKGKKVFRYLGNEIKTYDNIKLASIDNNVSTASIQQCLKGKSKMCNRYKWKYLKND